jgi:hypothetical protein
MNITSNYYWFRFADWYAFPHIIHFDSWYHLLLLLDSTDLSALSQTIADYNIMNRQYIMDQWARVFSLATSRKFDNSTRRWS